MTGEPKKRGRKPGVKTGPRKGSVRSMLAQMEVGEAQWIGAKGPQEANHNRPPIRIDDETRGRFSFKKFCAVGGPDLATVYLWRVERVA